MAKKPTKKELAIRQTRIHLLSLKAASEIVGWMQEPGEDPDHINFTRIQQKCGEIIEHRFSQHFMDLDPVI